MNTSTAIILGIIEGLTEFIPVSSTGHMIIVADWLKFKGDTAATFEIFIQLGAILAVVVLYKERFQALTKGTAPLGGRPHTESMSGFEGIKKIVIACIPAFILGFLFHSIIKEHLFSVITVAWALIVGGVAMIVIERRLGSQVDEEVKQSHDQLDQITTKQALQIGLFQCFALWPGMSRSASTIIGGLLSGVSRVAAAEFSFIIAVPVMCAAVGYDLLKSASAIAVSDLSFFAIGFIVSFFVAILAIKFFIGLLKRFTLAPFGWYRIVLGALLLLV